MIQALGAFRLSKSTHTLLGPQNIGKTIAVVLLTAPPNLGCRSIDRNRDTEMANLSSTANAGPPTSLPEARQMRDTM